MKETGILFTPEMHRAIRDGRKTQTRRVVKWKQDQPINIDFSGLRVENLGYKWVLQSRGLLSCWTERASSRCPYGHPDDRLWVREAWRTHKAFDHLNGTEMATKCLASGWKTAWGPVAYEVDGVRINWDAFGGLIAPVGRYRHPRFMPKWAARTWLEITEVRVQRLQEISEEDAKAEGLSRCPSWRQKWMCSGLDEVNEDPRVVFRALWDSINAKKHPWSSNPWVWCIGFQRIEAR